MQSLIERDGFSTPLRGIKKRYKRHVHRSIGIIGWKLVFMEASIRKIYVLPYQMLSDLH